MSPAQAASLESRVASLERKNLSTVNTNGAPEKHLPQVSTDGGSVTVVVPHVMDPEKPHFIEYIWLKDTKTNKVVAVNSFQATDPSPPTLAATVSQGSSVQAFLYCNLHGLWQGDTILV